MQTSNARTTININSTLLARLRLYAQKQNTTISSVVEQGVSQVINKAKPTKKKPYKQLFNLKGAATANPKLKNQPINEILYGENGAWRGSDR